MAKLSKHELREAILGDESLSDDVKGQLLDLLKTPTFGLVWEEKTEDVIERLRDELPILKEVKERAIISEDKAAPNHVLIEADNLEALVALTYTHAGKFDAIYIDPPYNSGATDWKYNNDYVDREDSYRHSKWLCMIEHRLKIAKRLLNPENSILVVTIDEKEYLHLGCLLEQLFPNTHMQMVSSVINTAGATRESEFARTDEYLYFVYIGEAKPQPLVLGKEWQIGKNSNQGHITWDSLRRAGSGNKRSDSPGCFYPIIVSEDGTQILSVGEALPAHLKLDSVIPPEGTKAIWPLLDHGIEGRWQTTPENLRELIKKGFVKLGKFSGEHTMAISYLKRGEQQKVESGFYEVIGHRADGSVIVNDDIADAATIPGTQWNIPLHNAKQHGTILLNSIIGKDKFSFPKSLYAVHDTLRFFVANNKSAKILDFFAGSGTTMHATMMLNQEDGGHRQCFLVTNNESNICEEVTYERNKRVIQGYTTPKGEQVAGLTGNSLRYYKVEHTPRKHTHENKMLLAQAMTEMLQIKWNAYDEPERFGSLRVKPRYMRYFSGDEDVLIIYVPEIIPYIVKEIKAMDNGKKLHVYVAADGNYAYSEEFGEVMKRIELASIPSAYYNAIKSILPAPTEEKGEYVPREEDEELLAHADKHDFQD